jgi:hypothetical protein
VTGGSGSSDVEEAIESLSRGFARDSLVGGGISCASRKLGGPSCKEILFVEEHPTIMPNCNKK